MFHIKKYCTKSKETFKPDEHQYEIKNQFLNLNIFIPLPCLAIFSIKKKTLRFSEKVLLLHNTNASQRKSCLHRTDVLDKKNSADNKSNKFKKDEHQYSKFKI